jgi:hypothetical protein
MGWLKRLSARLSRDRLGSLHIEDEISPERFKLWRFREVTESEDVVLQVIPVQLQ